MKKLREILGYIIWFWCFGGGFFIGLLCFILTWKLAVAVLCIWGCSLVTFFLWLMCEVVTKDSYKK